MTVIVADSEIIVGDIPAILKDRTWAVPFINMYRRHDSHGSPWGTSVGWLDWPAWYLEIYEAFASADSALEKDRT